MEQNIQVTLNGFLGNTITVDHILDNYAEDIKRLKGKGFTEQSAIRIVAIGEHLTSAKDKMEYILEILEYCIPYSKLEAIQAILKED